MITAAIVLAWFAIGLFVASILVAEATEPLAYAGYGSLVLALVAVHASGKYRQ